MKLPRVVMRELVVTPGQPARLDRRSTEHTEAEWMGDRSADIADRELEAFRETLDEAQQRLYASGTWSVLLILQGLDASGKDGTIKHVMSGVNPQGCRVASFKQPSQEELRHDFLWRCTRELPASGEIGIFNRSYYEEVLVVRVHPELLDAEHRPPELATGDDLWNERFDDINAFERHLVRSGTRVVKVFLHVSREEQRRRFLARLDDPAKHWKFSAADVREHEFFDDYRRAYESALTATSTQWAPWHVVPADHKRRARALVGGILVDALDALDLRLPEPSPDERRALEQARRLLERSSSDSTAPDV
jgi:PPK2 family polyphosphate:nucleotide phosphotransferase